MNPLLVEKVVKGFGIVQYKPLDLVIVKDPLCVDFRVRYESPRTWWDRVRQVFRGSHYTLKQVPSLRLDGNILYVHPDLVTLKETHHDDTP